VKSKDDWSPYGSRLEFELAYFLYTHNQMSASHINTLLDLWAASLIEVGRPALFSDHKQMYQTIDNTELGDVKWQSFVVKYTGDQGGDPAPWMNDHYDVWFRDPREVVRNMLANPNFADDMDYRPFREYDTKTSTRHWQDFMSGDWAWRQAVSIATSYYCSCLNQLVGYDCSRPGLPRIYICPDYSGIRQNDSVGSHRAEQLLPIIPVHWKHSQ